MLELDRAVVTDCLMDGVRLRMICRTRLSTVLLSTVSVSTSASTAWISRLCSAWLEVEKDDC